MKDIVQVLKDKEVELRMVADQVTALRLVLPLLVEPPVIATQPVDPAKRWP